ncbi:hypothetical protein AMATHDRAFT_95732, partial [Amanita thiersii Skay4041]
LSSNFSLFSPKKFKRRSTLLALLALVALSLYILFVQNVPLSSKAISRQKAISTDNMEQALETLRAHHHHKPHHHSVHRKQVKLDPEQELAALSSFLSSLPQNVIPSFIDPSLPIDPQLILDFDTRGSRADQEVQAIVHDVWTRNPVFLYSKLYSPVSREIKAILASLNLRPAPTIIDVDIRDDSDVLLPLLTRLTGSPELPVLIVGGKPISSVADIRSLDKKGELQNMIAVSGAVINGAKKKKHRR